MDHLTYPRKFLLISVLFGIPLALATYFLFIEIDGSLEIGRRQVVGLRYLEATQPLFRRIQEHMEAELAPLGGEAGRARPHTQGPEGPRASRLPHPPPPDPAPLPPSPHPPPPHPPPVP